MTKVDGKKEAMEDGARVELSDSELSCVVGGTGRNQLWGDWFIVDAGRATRAPTEASAAKTRSSTVRG